jgi:hypothetical protein
MHIFVLTATYALPSNLLILSHFWPKTFFSPNFLNITPHNFSVLKSVQMRPRHWQRPFWPWPMPRPRNFVFSLGDEIRRPSPNFVTHESYIGYIDDVKQKKLMSSLFMWLNNSRNTYKANDTSHGSLGWLQWHLYDT